MRLGTLTPSCYNAAMPRPAHNGPTIPLNMRFSETLIRALDDWRRTQPDLPTRQDAIRLILTEVLLKPVVRRLGRNDEAAQPQRGKIACEHCGGTGITD
jgi:hypothetical protein